MLESATSLLRSAALSRAVLLLNHVVASEPAATARLVPRAGQVVVVELAALPAPLDFLAPVQAPVSLQVTPAGLFELIDASALALAPGVPTLKVVVDASNPLLGAVRALAGERPQVRVEGDAAFAGDVHWLFENLRWDVQDDLAQRVGPAAAHEIGRIAGGLRQALRVMAGGLAGVVDTVTGGRDGLGRGREGRGPGFGGGGPSGR